MLFGGPSSVWCGLDLGLLGWLERDGVGLDCGLETMSVWSCFGWEDFGGLEHFCGLKELQTDISCFFISGSLSPSPTWTALADNDNQTHMTLNYGHTTLDLLTSIS